MTRTAAALLVLALSGSLAACGDDGADDLVPSAATSSPSGSAVPTTSPTTSPSSSVEPSATPAGEGEPAPTGFPAEPALSEQQHSGGPLSVTAVRVAGQDGYDRVVFELAGRTAGQAGWRVEYVDEPTAQGSGDPVAVDGDAVLAVLITGTGYPMDTGQDEVAGDPALPAGLQVVEDVVLGAVFEGQYEAFIGTSAQQPFRVTRLSDPERVVIDIRTP